MNKNITHKPESQRFELQLEGQVAYLSYVMLEGVIEYNHTIVPQALGGRGIGTELVKYALAYARVQHLKVIPSCSFVAALINKNNVYTDLLVDQ